MKKKPAFRVHFNRRKQHFDVHFRPRLRKYYGYVDTYDTTKGKFADMSLYAPDESVVMHELLHVWIEWMRLNYEQITDDNEEMLVRKFDEMLKSYKTAYEKYQKDQT